MNESTAWRDVKYAEVFQQELRGLNRRRISDPSCSFEDIEKTLHNLYIVYGADTYGRGELQDTIMAAAIAAHEYFIGEWKKEKEI